MNAGKLIELLQKLPPETEVLYYSEWKYLEYEPDETPSELWRVDVACTAAANEFLTENYEYSEFYKDEGSAKREAKRIAEYFDRRVSGPYKILAVY